MTHETVVGDIRDGEERLYYDSQALLELTPSEAHAVVAAHTVQETLERHLEQHATDPFNQHPRYASADAGRIALLAISANTLRGVRGGYDALRKSEMLAWVHDGQQWLEPAPLTGRAVNLDATLYVAGLSVDAMPQGRAVLGFKYDAIPTLFDTVTHEIAGLPALDALDVPTIALPVPGQRG